MNFLICFLLFASVVSAVNLCEYKTEAYGSSPSVRRKRSIFSLFGRRSASDAASITLKRSIFDREADPVFPSGPQSKEVASEYVSCSASEPIFSKRERPSIFSKLKKGLSIFSLKKNRTSNSTSRKPPLLRKKVKNAASKNQKNRHPKCTFHHLEADDCVFCSKKDTARMNSGAQSFSMQKSEPRYKKKWFKPNITARLQNKAVFLFRIAASLLALRDWVNVNGNMKMSQSGFNLGLNAGKKLLSGPYGSLDAHARLSKLIRPGGPSSNMKTDIGLSGNLGLKGLLQISGGVGFLGKKPMAQARISQRLLGNNKLNLVASAGLNKIQGSLLERSGSLTIDNKPSFR